MAALQPALVVPSHMKAGSAVDASAIAFTKDYLQTFEKNLALKQDQRRADRRDEAGLPPGK